MPKTEKAEFDTDQLLRDARQGDQQAVHSLLGRFRGRLRRMIAARMDPRLIRRVDPSDVVQETLVAAHRRLPDYFRLQPMDFYPWLRNIGWNCLVDMHRRHVLAERRTVDREVSIDSRLPDDSVWQLANRLLDPQVAPLSRMARSELRKSVRLALDRLTPAAREVLALRFLEQLSIAEASQVLGVSESAVKSRQVRALIRLRQLLDADAEESKK